MYSCVLVTRDKAWFKNAVVKIEELWRIVETEKITGYQHRAPKRRIVKKNDNKDPSQTQPKLELNHDGAFAPVSDAYENKCHSGLFF